MFSPAFDMCLPVRAWKASANARRKISVSRLISGGALLGATEIGPINIGPEFFTSDSAVRLAVYLYAKISPKTLLGATRLT